MAKRNNVGKPIYNESTVADELKQLISQPKKVVSDYKDPKDIEMDLIPELMEAYRLDYKRFVEEFGYSGSFLDYLRDEIDLKRRKYEKGGLSNGN